MKQEAGVSVAHLPLCKDGGLVDGSRVSRLFPQMRGWSRAVP